MGQPVVHFEIISPDPKATNKFYSELFGWKMQEIPDVYTFIDTAGGRGINGGIGAAREGDTPGIQFYVEVPECQKYLDKAVELGGEIAVPVTEVPDMVTFGIVKDPQGNLTGVVKEGEGPGSSPGDGAPVTWFEATAPDGKALQDFYVKLFDWKIKPSDEGGTIYGEVDTGSSKGISGGIGGSADSGSSTTVYAEVDDVEKYLERAESLGAKRVMDPMSVGEKTTIVLFADPQGLTMGIYRFG